MIDIETFRQLALSFPGTDEQPHFDKTSFMVNKKIFATVDTKKHRACVMLSVIDQSVFSTYDQSVIYPVPNKWGLQGATFIELGKVRKSMLKDSLKQAYNKIMIRKKMTVKKLSLTEKLMPDSLHLRN